MPYLEGAVVVIDNASGGIRALVGGRDYSQSKFNRALAAGESSGWLSFQTICLYTRFHQWSAAGRSDQRWADSARRNTRRGNWAPGNSDGTYGGIQPASYGLIHSRNTMSVRVGQFAGLDQVQKVATALNLNEKFRMAPQSTLAPLKPILKDLTDGVYRLSKCRNAETKLHDRTDR